ncbi:MAG: RNA polymerase sigma factor [Longimicrobiales bacterium]
MRAARGDRAAFDQLYARTVDRVYAVCLRVSGDRATAEALTQDTYVRVWQKLDTFRSDSAFTTWLHRLAVNVALNDCRQAQRRRGREHPLGDEDVLVASPDRADPTVRLDIERAIATLPVRARAVLVMHDVEGYKHHEIAELLGIATGTAKAQLHRARRLLQQRLER